MPEEQKTEQTSLAKTILLYTLVGLGSFIFFFRLTFPFDALKDSLVSSLEKQLSLEVEIQELNPRFFLNGITVKGLTLQNQEDLPPLLSVDRLKASLSLFSLISRTLSVGFHTTLYGGHIKGKVKKKSTDISLEALWQDLDISRYPLPFRTAFLQLRGLLNGNIDLSMNGTRIKNAEGSSSFLITGGVIEKLEIMGFKLPEISFSKVTGDLDIKGEKVTLKTFHMEGEDLEIFLDGKITLRERQLSSSLLNLKGKAKPSDQLANQFGPILSYLNDKKTADGFYEFSISGMISRPKLK